MVDFDMTGKQDQVVTAVGKSSIALGGLTASGKLLGFLNEYATAIGLGIALFGLLVNWYYKYKQDKREENAINLRRTRSGDN